MRLFLRLAPFAWLLGIVLTTTARAEHAKITLEVTAKGETKTSFMDQTPPDTGKNPRPIVKAKAGETVKIQYMLENIYPHKTLEGVVVHFYVAKQDKVGQKSIPNLNQEENLVIESAIDLTMKPGTKSGSRTNLRIDKPGVYLVRVETIKTQSDHEHFSAIDLVVEKAD